MRPGRIEKAILILNARQLALTDHSHISMIDPRAVLAVTLLYLISMLSVPLTSPGMLIWFAVYPIVSAPLAHVAYEKIFLRSLYVLPFIAAIGVFNPILDHTSAFSIGGMTVTKGWISFISIIIRGLLSVQALLVLIYVVGFNRICDALRAFGMPRAMVTQLLMVYRYMMVLLEEALAMQRARAARGYGRNSYGASMWGRFAGQLMLRTIDRSRRINKAMIARGFDGSMTWKRREHWQLADTVYCLIWIIVFTVLRVADLSGLLLSQFTK